MSGTPSWDDSSMMKTVLVSGGIVDRPSPGGASKGFGIQPTALGWFVNPAILMGVGL